MHPCCQRAANNSVRLWPADEIAWGRECLAAGDSVAEIAEAAGCAVEEVVANIGTGRLNETQREVVSLYVAGCSFEEIDAARGLTSTRLGSAAAAMISDLRKAGYPLPRRRDDTEWPPAKLKALKRLWGEGVTGRAIAEQLGGGVSRSAVLAKARRIGLAERKPPTRGVR